jgi:hypothetical protein
MTKKEVLQLLEEGHELCHAFFIKRDEWSINGNRVTSKTAKCVLLTEGVKLSTCDFSGITKHYYKIEKP